MKLSVYILIIIILFMVKGICFSQQNNALPPGPSTITGTLTDQYGNPIKDARITVKYPDGNQRNVDTFTSNEWGIFSVYIFRYDQPYIDLEIKVNNRICKIIRYDKPGRGMNMGHWQEKIICEVKQNRKKTNKRQALNSN